MKTNNVYFRWSKTQKKEREFISKNKGKYSILKARLLGYLAGDGNILVGNGKNNFHHTVRFFPDHESMISPYCESCLKLYNKVPKIQKLKNHHYLGIDSKMMVLDLLEEAKFGVEKWEVPFSTLETEDHKKEWLKAFFDCEAYVTNKIIRVQTVNKRGMDQVRQLLTEFGIVSNSYQHVPKNKNWRTNRILIIGTKESRKKYFSEIGFYHSLKQGKLSMTLDL